MPEPYANLTFPIVTSRPYVIVNMVATADGKATLNGRAHGIGDAHDHSVMQQLRSYADAVMSGAGTLIKEDIIPQLDEHYQQQRTARGRPPLPMALTLTSHNQFDWSKRFFEPQYRPQVFFSGSEAGELVRHAKVIPVNPHQAIPELLTKAKTQLAINLLLVEGGPSVNYSLLAARAVDELFVTISPKISGRSGLTIVEGAAELGLSAELLSLAHDGSELFARYRISYPPQLA